MARDLAPGAAGTGERLRYQVLSQVLVTSADDDGARAVVLRLLVEVREVVGHAGSTAEKGSEVYIERARYGQPVVTAKIWNAEVPLGRGDRVMDATVLDESIGMLIA
jgi:hypothetical protein